MRFLILAKVAIDLFTVRRPVGERRENAFHRDVREVLVLDVGRGNTHLEQFDDGKNRRTGAPYAGTAAMSSGGPCNQRANVYRGCHATSVTNRGWRLSGPRRARPSPRRAR